ncbi:MAG: hypothetical protein N4A45_13250 [Flavobacteriales bacterium]|jgi:hypothetical protein|nr:hypothetical protein [Flavobacteriales bacterium]
MKNLYQKLFKFFLIFAGSLIALSIFIFVFMNESIPMGSDPIEAQKVVGKMHKTLNKPAWDKTKYISWMTNSGHHYIWDKQNGFVQVQWKGKNVIFHQSSAVSKVFVNETEITNGHKKEKLLHLAKKYFTTDSYWFSAPFQIDEYQLSKDMVLMEGDSKRSLCVRYPSNHNNRSEEVYVYKFDDNYRPVKWKMWNNQFIIGGLETQWTNWKKSSTGFWYPLVHQKNFGKNYELVYLKAGFSLVEVGLDKNPFLQLK